MRIFNKLHHLTVLLLVLCLLSGCASPKTKPRSVLTPAEIQSISAGGYINLTDDAANSGWWKPKNQAATRKKVLGWLKQATPYTGALPQSDYKGVFYANIAPSVLYIKTKTARIEFQPYMYYLIKTKPDPRHYVFGVLRMTINKKVHYIRSDALYKWLKNDEWKPQFKRA